jgi:hypothetical protein
MTDEGIRHFLLWCTVINYGILLVWFLVFVSRTKRCIAFTADGSNCRELKLGPGLIDPESR